jgi:hypothetical protein
MREVRNLDRKLVCRVDDAQGIVEIALKNCKTLIRLTPDGKIEISQTRDK